MREEIQYFYAVNADSPVRIHLAGTSYCDGSYRICRKPPSVFVFEAVESGHGYLNVADQHLHPGAGDVYIAPCWKPHEYGSDASDPWIKSWLNLSGSLVEHLLRAYQIDSVYLFRGAEESSEIIRDAVRTLKGLSESECARFVPEMTFRLIRSLGEFHAKEKNYHHAAEMDSPASKQEAFLHGFITRPMPSLEDMAKYIDRSTVQTIRLFKQATGHTPYDFLLEEKMDAAAELLRNTRKPIKEIAFLLAFQDEYYFARLFRQRRGISPGRFRTGDSSIH